jgi:hypothetical protein
MNKAFAVLTLLFTAACASEKNTVQPEKSGASNPVDEINGANLEKFGGNPSFMVAPGVLADKDKKQVVVLAEMRGESQPEIEFLLLSRNSGHDYEALAVSMADARDIHKALEFIGMTPGRGVAYSKFRFWPKGERVIVHVQSLDAKKYPIRIEDLLNDNRTGKTMKKSGFVFTGSVTMDSPDNPSNKIYAAQDREPGSIISDYNEPETVLDVPLFATQESTYGHLMRIKPFSFSTNELVKIIMEPEFKDGQKRIMDCVLEIAPMDEADAAAHAARNNTAAEQSLDAVFSLKDNDGASLTKRPGLNGVLEALSSLVEKNRDPFVSLKFDDKLKLKTIAAVCRLLENIESANGIRVEPPPSGHLYFKAFNPNPKYLDKKERIVHPWELRLTRGKNGVLEGKLTQTENEWKDDDPSNPVLKVTEFNVPDPAALRKELDDEAERKSKAEKSPNIHVILIITKPDAAYGEITAFIKPVLNTHSTIHVYME